MDQLFENASKRKLRFEIATGPASVEDLWDMPLTSTREGRSLDDLAKSLNRAVKESAEESFVTKPSVANTDLQLGFDIVKYVIASKLADLEAANKLAARRAQRQRLLEAQARRQDADLSAASAEELQAQIDALAEIEV